MAYITECSHTQTVGGNKNFTVDFPFLARTDIKVQLNGVTKTVTNDYTIDEISGHTTVIFNTAPPTSPAATIRIFRDTNIDAIEATYAPGSSIRAGDLNNNNTQLLYAAQEFGTLKEDTSVSFTLGSKGDVTVNSSSDWSLNANSVELANMADVSVGTNELVDSCVVNSKVAANAIQTSYIQDNAITIAKMADDSVSTAELVNAAVTRAILESDLQYAFNPVGTVIWYAGSSAPTGYLKCNGDTITNSTSLVQGVTANWSALYAIVGTKLPDLRGEFLRGATDGRSGIEEGGTTAHTGTGGPTFSTTTVLRTQSDDHKSHTHTANTVTTSTTSLTGSITKISETFNAGGGTATGVFTKTAGVTAGNTPNATDNSPAAGVDFDASHSHTVTPTIQNTGGNETRPRNLALLACIKY